MTNIPADYIKNSNNLTDAEYRASTFNRACNHYPNYEFVLPPIPKITLRYFVNGGKAMFAIINLLEDAGASYTWHQTSSGAYQADPLDRGIYLEIYPKTPEDKTLITLGPLSHLTNLIN